MTPNNAAFASRRDFYTTTGENPFEIERDFLGRAETLVAPILREIRHRDAIPYGDPIAMGNLIGFVALQSARVRSVRERVSAAADAKLREVMLERYPTEEKWLCDVTQAQQAGVDIGPLTYKTFKLLLESDEVSYDIGRDWHLATMLHGFAETFDAFARRTWTLFRASPSSGLFVSSDAPVGLSMGDEGPFVGEFVIDPRDDETIVSLAIGPHHALISDRRLAPETIDVGPNDVATVNSATSLPNARALYAATQTFQWLDPRTRDPRPPGPELHALFHEIHGARGARRNPT